LLVDGLLPTAAQLLGRACDTGRASGCRHIGRAIDLLQGNPEKPWSPSTLAEAVSVSVRSLHEGFQRSVGMSPMTYLRELRLARVHKELTDATTESVTVTQVAVHWGFVHLGRFALVYRRKYGRPPSETLRAVSRFR
jgi:transcriptional regulator GlxA family with amidase domain